MILPECSMSILNNPKFRFNCNPVHVSRFTSFRLEIDFLLWLDKEVEFFIWLSLIDALSIPEANVAIWTSANDLLIVVSNEFDMTIMAKFLRADSYYWFDEISLPKKEFSVFGWTQHITIFELAVGNDVRKFELTELSDISLKFETSESFRNFPESNMSCSTCCKPFLVELTEGNPINILTECFGFQKQSFLLPLPYCQQEIRLRTHWGKHISTARKVNARVRLLSSFSKYTIQLQGRVLVDVDIGEHTHFSDSEIFLRRMDSYGANTSPVSGVKHLLVLRKVVEDGIADTWSEDDRISVEDLSIVALVTIVTIKSIKLDHAFRDGTFSVDYFNVLIIVEEVISYLHELQRTLFSCSSEGCYPLPSWISPF